MTDPIADMLTRIRNASSVGKKTVMVPFSRMKKALADILAAEGFVESVEVVKTGTFQELSITLRYGNNGKTSVIHKLKRVSKPGCRIYAKTDEMPVVLNDYGIVVVSTSQGLMTNRRARKERLGGELICEVS